MADGKNWAKVRQRCSKTAKRLFEDFDRKRRPILTEVCREFYPLGVAGLVKTTEDVADECWYDEEHRLLTVQPLAAVRNGACGFKSHLTPNAGGWFRFRPVGKGGAPGADGEAMDRLTQAVERAFDRSRAYDSLYKLYEHLLVAGFGCLLVTRHPRDVVRVRTLRLGTYAMGVDGEGDVVRVARRFSWTADQILGSFAAGGAPERVKEAAKKGDINTRWTVWNLVEPNAVGDMRAYDETARELALDDSMVYRSVYWIKNAKDAEVRVLDGGSWRAAPFGYADHPVYAQKAGDAPAADGGALALDSSDRTVLLSGANSGDGRVEVRSDDAWPLSILSISVNYEIQPLSNSEG